MSGILARAMIGVVATASLGSPWVSRITSSILRPLTPPAPLMASTAKLTPRLKPCVGAEAGPVIAARQPILIGSDSAMAGAGKEKDAAPNAPALPNKTPRREITIENSRLFPSSAPVVKVAGVAALIFGLEPACSG